MFLRIIVMYIEQVPNRNSPPAVLLRESYREDGKWHLKQALAPLLFEDEEKESVHEYSATRYIQT